MSKVSNVFKCGKCKLTITLAFLVGIGVVEKPLSVVCPGHAAEFNSLQTVFQRLGSVNPEETDLHPIRTAGTGAIGQVLSILREGISW